MDLLKVRDWPTWPIVTRRYSGLINAIYVPFIYRYVLDNKFLMIIMIFQLESYLLYEKNDLLYTLDIALAIYINQVSTNTFWCSMICLHLFFEHFYQSYI